MGTYLIGITVNTIGSKAMVVDLDGNVHGSGQKNYDCIYPKDNWVEQDADIIIRSAYQACREAVKNSGVRPQNIKAVGFSAQRSTFAFVDKNNNIIDNTFYSWQDNRAVSEMDYITSKMSVEELYSISGMPVTPTFSLEKIIWIKRNEPEKYYKSKYIVHLLDFIMYKFGVKEFYSEISNACFSGMIDLKKLKWSEKILDTYNIDVNKLPKLVKPGKAVGTISKYAAEKTGLVRGTILCTGSGNHQCAALGAGVIKEGKASLSLGTAGLLIAGTSKPVLCDKGLISCASAVENLYEIEGIQLGAASSYRWIRDIFGEIEKKYGEGSGIDPYFLMEKHIKKSCIGSNGILFIPHLIGAGYPYWNTESKGMFLGIKLSSTKSDMIRAVMEGITFASKDMYESMNKSGINIKSIAITGGPTKSLEWRQMFADILGVNIKKLKVEEATVIGAAVLAGVGSEIFLDIINAVIKLVHYTEIIKPNLENHNRYNEIYKYFTELNSRLNHLKDK